MPTTPKTYLSGPMTGYPSYNYAEFERVSTYLRYQGWRIVSPHEIPAPTEVLEEDALWKYYMERCREQMASCERIILMRGWPESRGALQELNWAIEDDMKIYYFDDLSSAVVPMSRRDL